MNIKKIKSKLYWMFYAKLMYPAAGEDPAG